MKKMYKKIISIQSASLSSFFQSVSLSLRRGVGVRLPAFCLLPIANRLLPASCLFPLAYCLLLLSSCSASKKLVNINKAHTDSTVIEHAQKNYSSIKDSISTKTTNFNYKKETTNTLQPVEISQDDSVPLGIVVITNKKTGKKKIFLPAETITEWGNIAASDQVQLKQKTDSSVNQQKTTNLISEKKSIVKQKEKSAPNFFNLLWLLLLIPLFIIIKKLLPWIKRLL